ncbi:MAG: flavodoxin [Lachnospiraceae bacterium]|nr:flavodoxin [Lachnospiraceae bacterium]
MKRRIAFVLLVCMVFMLAACSSESAESSSDSESSTISITDSQSDTESETEGTDTDTSEEAGDEATDSDSNILVAYFSCTGTTEQVAGWIAEETEADIYEIVPETPYTEDDLNYNDSSSRANQEQADSSARPAISGSVENIEQYDVIFLGYPIWHGQAPRIVSTFLESYDLSDVTIIPFCTSHSSGIGSSAENLHDLCSDTVTWMEGRRFSGDATESEVAEWVEGLELPESEARSVGEFDFETKTVLLNSGYEMPIMGLGTYSLTDEEMEQINALDRNEKHDWY